MFAVIAASCANAAAAEEQHCVPAQIVLWGDGRHDDTAALNAWLHGRPAIWGDSGAPVGAAIGQRNFRLSAPVYVPAGTGRSLADFTLRWPDRGETVAGGRIAAGHDPNAAPVMSGISIVGGDPGEGRPFEAPDPPPPRPDPAAGCATS
ncbi:MAG TPA: hypothetical protein VJR70_02970 [Stellaceae bacterium]|nr:hypothetical protein [Stellaceae bacterium]